MKFDPFVLPFTVGLIVLLVLLSVKYARWILKFSPEDKRKLGKGFFSVRLFFALKEILLESLLHRKIFKTNILLGFMHASLAFGWFVLIVAGNIESKLVTGNQINPPYFPIFLDFFIPVKTHLAGEWFFSFIMDFFLLLVLTAVALAFSKRFFSKWFGMKKTTQKCFGDRFALLSLWFIFPLRFLAESFTAGEFHTGGFLTGTFGELFAKILPVSQLAYPAWWAYSIALGVFFVSLPYSRYMHIPTEVLLIICRNFGIKAQKRIDSFNQIEVYSCSRCGICIDTCQLSSAAKIHKVQSVYFLQTVRNSEQNNSLTNNCLLCGRCKIACPVGINTNGIRLQNRAQITSNQNSYNYLKSREVKKTEILYFAGCMTHLTPPIKKAMLQIFEAANINYQFFDADGSVCCGRPQMLAGQTDEARKLISYNKTLIQNSSAKTLVTSCPICYKVFKEEYNLEIEILHHSEYILRLIQDEKIELNELKSNVVYHDPCELGRNSLLFNEPRMVLQSFTNLLITKHERENALCCGGSLGNLSINNQQRNMIANEAIAELTKDKPDVLVTACPLCKKTFANKTSTQIQDIAELVAKALIKREINPSFNLLEEHIADTHKFSIKATPTPELTQNIDNVENEIQKVEKKQKILEGK